MLIKNARIITMAGAPIDRGYIQIENGKITGVGDMAGAPETVGEESLDLTGKHVLPGFIDAHSHIGLQENGLGDEGDDINEMTDPFTPHLRALDGINPFDRCFDEARAAGVTTVAVSPGSANPIGGQICALKTQGRWIDEMVISEPLAIKMAFGENPKMTYMDKAQAPSTRMATAAIIRENLYKAKRYMQDKEKALEEEDSLPDYDAKLEALIPLLKGEIRAHIHAHKAYDILTGIRLMNEFALDYTLVHCTEGYLIADILAGMGARAICGPMIGTRTKPELSGLCMENCKKLEEAGVAVAICTDHPEVPADFLPLSMQIAHANGLDAEASLASLTISAAKALGLETRIGSITPGKDADLLIYAGDPMAAFSKPESVYINGERCRG